VAQSSVERIPLPGTPESLIEQEGRLLVAAGRGGLLVVLPTLPSSTQGGPSYRFLNSVLAPRTAHLHDLIPIPGQSHQDVFITADGPLYLGRVDFSKGEFPRISQSFSGFLREAQTSSSAETSFRASLSSSGVVYANHLFLPNNMGLLSLDLGRDQEPTGSNARPAQLRLAALELPHAGGRSLISLGPQGELLVAGPSAIFLLSLRDPAAPRLLFSLAPDEIQPGLYALNEGTKQHAQAQPSGSKRAMISGFSAIPNDHMRFFISVMIDKETRIYRLSLEKGALRIQHSMSLAGGHRLLSVDSASRLWIASSSAVELWSLDQDPRHDPDPRLLEAFAAKSEGFSRVAWLPDGRLAIGSRQQGLQLLGPALAQAAQVDQGPAKALGDSGAKQLCSSLLAPGPLR